MQNYKRKGVSLWKIKLIGGKTPNDEEYKIAMQELKQKQKKIQEKLRIVKYNKDKENL